MISICSDLLRQSCQIYKMGCCCSSSISNGNTFYAEDPLGEGLQEIEIPADVINSNIHKMYEARMRNQMYGLHCKILNKIKTSSDAFSQTYSLREKYSTASNNFNKQPDIHNCINLKALQLYQNNYFPTLLLHHLRNFVDNTYVIDEIRINHGDIVGSKEDCCCGRINYINTSFTIAVNVTFMENTKIVEKHISELAKIIKDEIVAYKKRNDEVCKYAISREQINKLYEKRTFSASSPMNKRFFRANRQTIEKQLDLLTMDVLNKYIDAYGRYTYHYDITDNGNITLTINTNLIAPIPPTIVN